MMLDKINNFVVKSLFTLVSLFILGFVFRIMWIAFYFGWDLI